jgi:hypothetical protein
MRPHTALVPHGASLAAAHARHVPRAATRAPITRDAALSVLAEGRPPEPRGGHIRLRARARSARLRARIRVPREVDAAMPDQRRLGIAIAALRLEGIPLALDDPRLACGWHAPEEHLRWTEGEASIVTDGVRTLGFDVAMTGRAWHGA